MSPKCFFILVLVSGAYARSLPDDYPDGKVTVDVKWLGRGEDSDQKLLSGVDQSGQNFTDLEVGGLIFFLVFSVIVIGVLISVSACSCCYNPYGYYGSPGFIYRPYYYRPFCYRPFYYRPFCYRPFYYRRPWCY